MVKILFLFFLFLLGCDTDVKPVDQEKFIHLLKELFQVLNIENDGTLSQMNEIAQKELLRKPGQERWEMAQSKYENKKDKILHIIDKLGGVQEVIPSKSKYDYILIQGALIKRMRDRLKYLDTLWPYLDDETKKNIKIVILTGGRELDPVEENLDVLFNQKYTLFPFRVGWTRPDIIPKTEKEAAELAWDQIIENTELRAKVSKGDVLFVNTPKMGDPPRRPQARDTLYYWMDSWENRDLYSQEYQKFWASAKKAPNVASYLVISNNPYIPFQQKVMENSMKKRGWVEKGVTIETVGPAADSKTSIAVHLDNIARILYEEAMASKT